MLKVKTILSDLKKEDLLLYLKAWWSALRFFSLVIALFSCLLGVITAFLDGKGDVLRAVLTLAAGLALQAGVNLINDHFEFRSSNIEDKIPHLRILGRKRALFEWVVYFSGLAFLGAASLIGLYLVIQTGWFLLLLGAVGLFGAYFYTAEPVNYKRRGLAVLLVFFLMGILMITGSYYAVAGEWSRRLFWLSLPPSALVSHILLLNEIRDWEYDIRHGHKTLTWRIGVRRARALSYLLLAFAYLGPVILIPGGIFPHYGFLWAAFPLIIQPCRGMYRNEIGRKRIIPAIMLHHGVYGILFLLTLLLPLG